MSFFGDKVFQQKIENGAFLDTFHSNLNFNLLETFAKRFQNFHLVDGKSELNVPNLLTPVTKKRVSLQVFQQKKRDNRVVFGYSDIFC